MPTQKKPKTTPAAVKKPRVRKTKTPAHDRYLRIQEAAYLKAEKDAFRNDPIEYWLEAERELDAEPS